MAAAVEARRLLSQVVCAALVLVSGSQKTDRKVSQRDVGRCRAELLASNQHTVQHTSQPPHPWATTPHLRKGFIPAAVWS